MNFWLILSASVNANIILFAIIKRIQNKNV